MSIHSPTPGPWQRITSPKHPGAVFFKQRGRNDNFICKVYAGHASDANLIEASSALLAAAELQQDAYTLTNDDLTDAQVVALLDAHGDRASKILTRAEVATKYRVMAAEAINAAIKRVRGEA